MVVAAVDAEGLTPNNVPAVGVEVVELTEQKFTIIFKNEDLAFKYELNATES